MVVKYHFEGENQIPSPALIYYKDAIVKNVQAAIEEAGGAERLWPHVKSHKMEAVLKLQVQMGIRRFKCATVSEAAIAAEAGGQHILLAYPLVGPGQKCFLDLIKKWPDRTFYAIGDDLEQIRQLAVQASERGLKVNLCVDVNTGMNRTGVDFERLPEFCEGLSGMEGVRLAGFHCYDGDRHEKDPKERGEKVKETIGKINTVMDGLAGGKGKDMVLVMGGSPSFPCYAREMKETGVFYSPGTIFIYDVGYQSQFPDLPYEPAAAVLARVVSHPAEGYFTIDCGYKAVSAEQAVPGVLVGIPYAKAAFQSEEHWTFQMEKGQEDRRPAIGQIVYVMPWHICPTTALYDAAVAVSGGRAEAVWQVNGRNRLTGEVF